MDPAKKEREAKTPEANNTDDWHLVISPRRHLFEINLKEIWQYRDLILLFVRRNFVAKYKQTILGPLWFIIQPLLTVLMYTIVFGRIAGISSDGLPRILFYLAGVVCWTYFAQSLTLTSNTFVQNAPIFGKVYFPRLTLPISIVISNLLLFSIQFLLFISILSFHALKGTDIHLNWNMLWFVPVLVILLAGLALGFGIIISSLTTKYRDLTQLVVFGVQLWMYATPIIYPLSEIKSEKYKLIILLNPISSIVETFRYIFLGVGAFSWQNIAYSGIFCIAIIAIGIVLFNRVEKNFMDTV